MAEPTIGDSKKKGLASGAIMALAGFHNETNSIYVIVAVTLIALWCTGLFAWLEKKPKADNGGARIKPESLQ